MEEKHNDPILEISSSENIAEGSDFCLLSEDDFEMEDTENRMPPLSRDSIKSTSSVDVESMKRKADEIASSLRKFRNNRTSDASVPSEDYELSEELKRYRERSVFVAQKLKEDRLLFEESKKRNEAVVDKVRTMKQIHKSISESAKELRRDDPAADEMMALRLKIERLEASLSHVQKTLTSKNQIIFENKETIRTLNESVDSMRSAYLTYVEQSQEEIQQLRDEHVKALEKIANSRDEFYNQLQAVRKKCLLMENDFKLSEFARFRLVSRNAELRERVCQLETELKIPHTKSMSLEDIDDTKSDISVGNQTVAVNDLHPKIECLTTVTNGFCSYLLNTGDCDFDDLIQLDDNSYPLQAIDKVSDRLESVFYVVRDRLSSFTDLKNYTKRTEEKLGQLEALLEENKNQDAKMKKILATMKAKIQSEININKDLAEQLSKAQESIRQFEQNSSQDWVIRCRELENANQQLKNELSTLQNNSSTREPSHQLQGTISQLKRELEAKVRECEELRLICEELEDTNDKLENDFVVLRTRDCDEEENWKRSCAQLKDENVQILENLRSLSEKAIDYENERLSLYRQIDELRQTVNDLTEQLEMVNKQSFAVRDAKLEQDGEMRAEIEDLTAECGALSKELDEVKKQLTYESSSNRDLREQMHFAENTNAMLSQEMHNLQKRNQDLEIVKTALEENIDELKKRIESVESEKAHLQEYIEWSKGALSDYERVRKERDAELEYVKNYSASLQTETEKLRAEKEAMEAEWEEYKEKTANDEVNTEALRRANEELTSSVRQLRQSVSEMEDEKEQLVSHYEAQLVTGMRSLQELDDLRSQVVTLEKEKQQLRDRFEEYRDRIQILENENEQSRSENSHEIQVRVETLEAEKRQLELECEKFKNKYQRLQVYCKKNIDKTSSEAEKSIQNQRTSADSNVDAEKWRTAWMKAQDELTKAQERETQLNSSNAEAELWKRKYEDANAAFAAAQQEMINLKQLLPEYKTELQRTQETVTEQKSPLAQHSDENQLLDVASAVDVVVNECMRRTDEDVQNAVDEVVNECLLQTDELCNCINDLKQENRRLREQRMEMEGCQTKVDQLQEELRFLRSNYNNLEQRLYNMEEESALEIARYQESLTRARSDLETMEECLGETKRLLQQKENDFYDYRCQMEEFLNAERTKYEGRLAALDSNKSKNDAIVQTDTEGSEKEPATIAKYFDYYKGKIEKEITKVLQPEQQPTDYSNWILPERHDVEYQARYQQVPAFSYEDAEEDADASLNKGSQTLLLVHTQSQISQTEISNLGQECEDPSPRAPSRRESHEKLTLTEVIDQLRESIINKMNGDEWAVNEADWLVDELDIYSENFVNTSLKFVDLFESVIGYYSTVPQTAMIVDKFKNIVGITQSEFEGGLTQWDHRDSYNQLVKLCTHLECENKYLVDAVAFVEDTILARHQAVDIINFQDVIQQWRTNTCLDETDIIDRVCEEFDIIPSKFNAGAQFPMWKETIRKLLEPPASAVVAPAITESGSYSLIVQPLVFVMKKNHKLIGDLYYKYGSDKNFDPNEFFEQIDDINQDVERLVKFVKGEIAEITDIPAYPAARQEDRDDSEHHHHDQSDKDHHLHDHDHNDHHHHDHSHEDHHVHDDVHEDHRNHRHGREDHIHQVHNESEHKADDSNTVAELKLLLAESNKKIDSLVRELMEAKNSKDYNEMRQLHAKLDETLYHLHLRDVDNAELTQELTQLLSERDALQLKLSSIIRQYEELRQAFVAANKSDTSCVQLSGVSEKLEELHKVNYMKDPRISVASKQYHATEMQLFNEDSAETAQRGRDESTSGFSVPSLFKWITGDTDGK